MVPLVWGIQMNKAIGLLHLVTLALLFALPQICNSQADYQIYGMFDYYRTAINARTTNVIYSRCFSGVGLLTCVPKQADDDYVRNYDLPYVETIPDYYGSTYCVQCCGTNPTHIDTWDLYCPTDAGTRSQFNLYGYELRLARNRGNGDNAVITCPLRRSACTYTESGATISCDRASDNTSLAGYTLKLRVKEWDSMFAFWRGVESCEIETVEMKGQLPLTYKFHEKIIIDHTPLKYPNYDYPKVLIVLVLVVFIVYGFLYFCRRKRCPYCQNKLVISLNLCMACRFYGVKPPDPVMLKALESKGEIIQGPIPERFPGAKMVVGLVRFFLSWMFGWCFRSSRAIRVHPIIVYKSNLELAGIAKESQASMDLEESKIDQDMDEILQEEDIQQNQEPITGIGLKKPSKYERMRAKWEKQRLKAMEKNSNILDQTPELIFQAVDHPKFMEFKPKVPPTKRKGTVSPYQFP